MVNIGAVWDWSKNLLLSGKQSPAKILFLVNFREFFLANFTSCSRSRTISVLLPQKLKAVYFYCYFLRKRSENNLYKIFLHFSKKCEVMGKNSSLLFFQPCFVFDFGRKKHVQNLVSRDFSEKSGENSLLDLDLKSF